MRKKIKINEEEMDNMMNLFNLKQCQFASRFLKSANSRLMSKTSTNPFLLTAALLGSLVSAITIGASAQQAVRKHQQLPIADKKISSPKSRNLLRQSARTKVERVAQELRMSEYVKTPQSRYLSPVSGMTVGQTENTQTASAPKIFAGTIYLIRGTTPRAENPEVGPAKKEAMTYYGLFSAKISDNWATGTEVMYNQDLNQPKRSDWADTPLVLTYRGLKPAPALGMSTSLIGVIPTSNGSKQRALQHSLGGAMRFWINSAYMPFSEKLNFSVYANLLKGTHSRQYDPPATAEGDPTYFNSYTSRQTVSLSYNGDIFFASVDFHHRNAITYNNTLKESYLHTESIGFVIDKKYTLALSHEFGGPAHQENGQSNYYFFSDETSYYSAILGFSF